MRKPTVLMYGRFLDEIPGGIQTHATNLIYSLHREINFYHLVCSRNLSNSKFKIFNKIPVERCSSFNFDGSFVFSPTLVYRSLKIKKYEKIDIIHQHFPDPMAHFASLSFSRKIPRIITWHADIFKYKVLKKLYYPFLIKELLAASAIIIPTQNHQKTCSLLSHPLLQNKIYIIPFGFNLKKFKTAKNKKSDSKKFTIFALGRHVPYKGFEILISSLKHLPGYVTLCLGGTGPLTESYKKQVSEMGLTSRVKFPGNISDNSLPEFYHSADIFCLPSITKAEAFGIVQIEAMAAGLPVVSTRLGTGVEEVNINGFTGFTVKPGDAVDLAKALKILIANTCIRRAFGQAGQKRAFNEYSLEKMKKPTLALYRNLCEKSL